MPAQLKKGTVAQGRVGRGDRLDENIHARILISD
jgi:hypothetical protein